MKTNTGGPVDSEQAPGPDAKALARRMSELKAWARENGYFYVPLWEQLLRCGELAAFAALAFLLLTQGGVAAVAGAALLAIYYPRAAYLAHDIAHGQWGPRDWTKTRFMLGVAAITQGFGLTWWVEKHELHHAFPNGCRLGTDGVLRPLDGDIDTAPWLVWDKALAKHGVQAPESIWGNALSWVLPRLQVPLFFSLLALSRFNWSWQSIQTALSHGKLTEAALCAAHWILGLTAAGFLTPGAAWTGWAWFIAAQMLGGTALASVFVLNHTGMDVYDASKSGGFYDRQARATRNTPSSKFLDWMMGGLNSQIEHHMFPAMARRNLSKIRDATRRAMLECGYSYEVLGNRKAMQAVLSSLSEAAKP